MITVAIQDICHTKIELDESKKKNLSGKFSVILFVTTFCLWMSVLFLFFTHFSDFQNEQSI